MDNKTRDKIITLQDFPTNVNTRQPSTLGLHVPYRLNWNVTISEKICEISCNWKE